MLMALLGSAVGDNIQQCAVEDGDACQKVRAGRGLLQQKSKLSSAPIIDTEACAKFADLENLRQAAKPTFCFRVGKQRCRNSYTTFKNGTYRLCRWNEASRGCSSDVSDEVQCATPEPEPDTEPEHEDSTDADAEGTQPGIADGTPNAVPPTTTVEASPQQPADSVGQLVPPSPEIADGVGQPVPPTMTLNPAPQTCDPSSLTKDDFKFVPNGSTCKSAGEGFNMLTTKALKLWCGGRCIKYPAGNGVPAYRDCPCPKLWQVKQWGPWEAFNLADGYIIARGYTPSPDSIKVVPAQQPSFLEDDGNLCGPCPAYEPGKCQKWCPKQAGDFTKKDRPYKKVCKKASCKGCLACSEAGQQCLARCTAMKKGIGNNQNNNQNGRECEHWQGCIQTLGIPVKGLPAWVQPTRRRRSRRRDPYYYHGYR